MKRIVLLTCMGSITLALTAWGAPKGRHASRSGKAKTTQTVAKVRSSHVGANRGSRR